eukprot:92428-Chlamydomonas_euryale.AAC.2
MHAARERACNQRRCVQPDNVCATEVGKLRHTLVRRGPMRCSHACSHALPVQTPAGTPTAHCRACMPGMLGHGSLQRAPRWRTAVSSADLARV